MITSTTIFLTMGRGFNLAAKFNMHQMHVKICKYFGFLHSSNFCDFTTLVKNHTSHFTHVTVYILTDTKMDKMTLSSFIRTAFHNIKQS